MIVENKMLSNNLNKEIDKSVYRLFDVGYIMKEWTNKRCFGSSLFLGINLKINM